LGAVAGLFKSMKRALSGWRRTRITCKPLAGVSSHTQVLVVNWGTGAPERPAQNEPAAGKKRRRGS
jgi:hypothetical protein